MAVEANSTAALVKVHYRQTNGLNGKVVYYNLDGSFSNGVVYKDGKPRYAIQDVPLREMLALKKQGKWLLPNDRNVVQANCYTVYTATGYMGCVSVGGYQNCEWYPTGYSSHTECDDDHTQPSSIGDGYGSGGGSTNGPPLPPDCTGKPGGTAYTDPTCNTCIGGTTGLTACPKEVRDSVKNPCIKAQLNLALTAKTTILIMLNSTFGGTVEFEDLSLTFTDVTTLPDTVSGDAGRASATSIYFDIRLNKNTLPAFAKEYTLSTIYHEILHAYLYSKLTKGPDGRYDISTQHEDMANKYLILMTGALKIAFPNISDQEAWALSWGGLAETNLYDKKLSKDQKDIIAEINRKHTNKSTTKSGTYCN